MRRLGRRGPRARPRREQARRRQVSMIVIVTDVSGLPRLRSRAVASASRTSRGSARAATSSRCSASTASTTTNTGRTALCTSCPQTAATERDSKRPGATPPRSPRRAHPRIRGRLSLRTLRQTGPKGRVRDRLCGPDGQAATSRSFAVSARTRSFFRLWFSICRIRSRVTLNVRPTSSSVRGG
jgi:hypothetical protein